MSIIDAREYLEDEILGEGSRNATSFVLGQMLDEVNADTMTVQRLWKLSQELHLTTIECSSECADDWVKLVHSTLAGYLGLPSPALILIPVLTTQA
jgi:hypothetical protein